MREKLQRRVKGMRIRLPRTGISMGCVLRSLFLIGGAVVCVRGASIAGSGSLDPSTMKKIATIDERYQSYNVEMAEVTGGSFWKPYSKASASPSPASASSSDSYANVPGGMDPSIINIARQLTSPTYAGGSSRQRSDLLICG
jgi:hypothetical protein